MLAFVGQDWILSLWIPFNFDHSEFSKYHRKIDGFAKMFLGIILYNFDPEDYGLLYFNKFLLDSNI